MSKGGVPGDFFNRVFLDKPSDVASEVAPKEQLFSELMKVAKDDTIEKAPLSSYTPLDSELVKVAKLTIFFNTLNFLCKD